MCNLGIKRAVAAIALLHRKILGKAFKNYDSIHVGTAQRVHSTLKSVNCHDNVGNALICYYPIVLSNV